MQLVVGVSLAVDGVNQARRQGLSGLRGSLAGVFLGCWRRRNGVWRRALSTPVSRTRGCVKTAGEGAREQGESLLAAATCSPSIYVPPDYCIQARRKSLSITPASAYALPKQSCPASPSPSPLARRLASTTPHHITSPPNNNKYQVASHGRSAQNFHPRESERLPFVSITLIRPANPRIRCHYSAGDRRFATTARFACTRTHCGRVSMRRTALTAAATSHESVGSERKRRLADRPAVGI